MLRGSGPRRRHPRASRSATRNLKTLRVLWTIGRRAQSLAIRKPEVCYQSGICILIVDPIDLPPRLNCGTRSLADCRIVAATEQWRRQLAKAAAEYTRWAAQARVSVERGWGRCHGRGVRLCIWVQVSACTLNLQEGSAALCLAKVAVGCD